MNNRNPLLPRAAAVLATGGLAWLAKMAVIGATDGAGDGSAESVAAVLYVLGVVLMPLGLAGIAFAAAAPRHVAVRLLASAAGLLAFFIAFVAMDELAKGLVGDTGPAWLPDEAGILATGVVLMALGLLLARDRRAAAA